MGAVDPSRQHVMMLIWQLEECKWLKNGAGKGFIFYAIVPALYPFVKIVLVKLKYLYIQYA